MFICHNHFKVGQNYFFSCFNCGAFIRTLWQKNWVSINRSPKLPCVILVMHMLGQIHLSKKTRRVGLGCYPTVPVAVHWTWWQMWRVLHGIHRLISGPKYFHWYWESASCPLAHRACSESMLPVFQWSIPSALSHV